MRDPINRYLDAAILVPETTRDDFEKAVAVCLGLDVFSVCVRPCDVGPAQDLCRGSKTAVCVVLGFPHGSQLAESKADEARRYLAMGIDEIDMVANYGWARSGLWDEVRADIAGVAGLTRAAGVPLKVIFETARLDPPTISRLVGICVEAGADYVKTSTGFNGAGASEEDVMGMLEAADGRIKVKASGGIRDRTRAGRFLDLGVHRLWVNWASCVSICTGRDLPSAGGTY